MLRRGLLVSSPSAAAPSKPPNDSSPNTDANATAPMVVPEAGTNGLSVKCCPFGAVWQITFQKITMTTIAISVTEMPSNVSSARPTMRTSPYASTHTSAAAISEIRIHDGLCQMPLPSKNDEPNRPISAMSATMNSEYVASSVQPAKNPARGPSVTPASAYVEPAWLKNVVKRMNEYEM